MSSRATLSVGKLVLEPLIVHVYNNDGYILPSSGLWSAPASCVGVQFETVGDGWDCSFALIHLLLSFNRHFYRNRKKT